MLRVSEVLGKYPHLKFSGLSVSKNGFHWAMFEGWNDLHPFVVWEISDGPNWGSYCKEYDEAVDVLFGKAGR